MSELPARPRYAAEVMGRMRHLHFVGIGGAGMNGIAQVILNLGYQVSGSDIRQNAATLRLAEQGAAIHIGHTGAHIQGVDAVVSGQITEAITQWADEVAALGGAEPLTRFRDAKVGTLDLSAADDSQRRSLMDGVPVRVRDVAEVEVDLETGQVEIKRVVAAHDVGKAINPLLCTGQIEGGVHMGLGYALTEDFPCTDGHPDPRVHRPQEHGL